MSNELVPMGSSGAVEAYGKYAQAGKESIDEKVLPIMHVCQPMSPEVVEREVASAGDFVLRPADINFGKAFCGVVLWSQKEWILWKDKDTEGGGIEWRGKYETLTEEQQALCQWDGNNPPEANETRTLLVVEYDRTSGAIDPRGSGPFMLSFSRSSAKNGKKVLQALKMFKGPIFGAVFEFANEKQTNEYGTFYVPSGKGLGAIADAKTLESLNELHEQLKQMWG